MRTKRKKGRREGVETVETHPQRWREGEEGVEETIHVSGGPRVGPPDYFWVEFLWKWHFYLWHSTHQYDSLKKFVS